MELEKTTTEICTCVQCLKTEEFGIAQLFYPTNKSRCRTCILFNAKKNKKVKTPEQKEKNAKVAKVYYTNNLMRIRFNAAKDRARKSGLEFTITEELIIDLILRQNYRCAISTVVFDNTNEKYTPSLERIDSSKGYTVDNVMWVCAMVNYMKNDYTTEDFQDMVMKIAENIEKKRQS